MPKPLLINGTVGVGKTTVADALGRLLTERGRPNAVIDLDWLRNAWPAPRGDRFNTELTLTNLTSLAANFRAAGHDQLILAGVVESSLEREAHEIALGEAMIMVRLVVDGPTVDARIRARHANDPASRDWHLHRRPELAAILDTSAADDLVVEVGELDGVASAQVILDRVEAYDPAP